jgi:hypothetical protein
MRLLNALVLLSLAPLGLLGQAVVHLEDRVAYTRGPVTNRVTDARLLEAANQYRAIGRAARFGLFDLAYPADSVDLPAFDGFAVLLVTVVSQDSSELPPGRVFLRYDSHEAPLRLLGGLFSPVADPTVRLVLGRYRVDAFYLVPTRFPASAADILIDFARNRSNFHLGGLRSTDTGPLGTVPPSDSAIRVLVRREYPDMISLLTGQAP